MKFFYTCLLMMLGFNFLSVRGHAEEAHPGLSIESMQAEAVLAYNLGDKKKALTLIAKILERDPKNIETLELDALILKSSGEDKPALSIYAQLIRLRAPELRGPYYFEAAVIMQRLGRKEDAEIFFEAALRLNFNVSAAHLFLGMLRFNGGRTKEASRDFQVVAQTGLEEMKVVAHYYLGVIYLKEGYAAGGAEEFSTAREIAKSIPGNKTATDTLAGIDRVMDSFRSGQWFANLALINQYDSNISQVPTSSSLESQASHRATAQTAVSAGVGYMTAASQCFQWVPTYQFSYNHNYNAYTKSYEYAGNNLGLYINYLPLNNFSSGFKIAGSYTFQNALVDSSNVSSGYQLSRYSISGDFGPYIKVQLSPRLRYEAELSFRPQYFYTQADLTGKDYIIKMNLHGDTNSNYWNPGIGINFQNSKTRIDTYKQRNLALSLFDTIHLTARDTLTATLDLTYYDYYLTLPVRQDRTINPHLSLLHSLTGDHWNLLGNFGYTKNFSTIADSYDYKRFALGLGASYSF